MKYRIQKIRFGNKDRYRILQSKDGPCPIIAILNVLLLRGDIDCNLDTSLTDSFSIKDLTDALKQYMTKSQNNNKKIKYQNGRTYTIKDCFKELPKLERGLDINIKFKDVNEFEKSIGTSIFYYCDIKLYHVWVVNNQDKFLYELVGDKTYDEVQTILATSVDDRINELKEELKSDDDGSISINRHEIERTLNHEKNKIKQFLGTNKQTTIYGYIQLHETMKNNEISVLFKNNHFSVIHKYNDRLYELITTVSFVEQDNSLMFTTLSQINNDERFVDNNYQTMFREFKDDYSDISLDIERNDSIPDDMDDLKDDNCQDTLSLIDKTISYIDTYSDFENIKLSMVNIPSMKQSTSVPETPTCDDNSSDDINIMDKSMSNLPSKIERSVSNVNSNDVIDELLMNSYIKNCEYNVRIGTVNDSKDIANLLKNETIIDNNSDLIKDTTYFRRLFLENCIQYGYVLEKNGKIIGYVGYKWSNAINNKNGNTNTSKILINDFYDKSIHDDFNNPKYWKPEYKKIIEQEMKNEIFRTRNNINLEKYYPIYKTGVVYITDFVIHSKYHNQSQLYKQLLKRILYSFPSKTKFAIDIRINNKKLLKIFIEEGFDLIRLRKSISQDFDVFKLTKVTYFTNNDVIKYYANLKIINDSNSNHKTTIVKDRWQKGKLKLKALLNLSDTNHHRLKSYHGDNKFDDDDDDDGKDDVKHETTQKYLATIVAKHDTEPNTLDDSPIIINGNDDQVATIQAVTKLLNAKKKHEINQEKRVEQFLDEWKNILYKNEIKSDFYDDISSDNDIKSNDDSDDEKYPQFGRNKLQYFSKQNNKKRRNHNNNNNSNDNFRFSFKKRKPNIDGIVFFKCSTQCETIHDLSIQEWDAQMIEERSMVLQKCMQQIQHYEINRERQLLSNNDDIKINFANNFKNENELAYIKDLEYKRIKLFKQLKKLKHKFYKDYKLKYDDSNKFITVEMIKNYYKKNNPNYYRKLIKKTNNGQQRSQQINLMQVLSMLANGGQQVMQGPQIMQASNDDDDDNTPTFMLRIDPNTGQKMLIPVTDNKTSKLQKTILQLIEKQKRINPSLANNIEFQNDNTYVGKLLKAFDLGKYHDSFTLYAIGIDNILNIDTDVLSSIIQDNSDLNKFKWILNTIKKSMNNFINI